MTGEPRPPVQRAPVTWREWGLCFHSPWDMLYMSLGARILRHAEIRFYISDHYNYNMHVYV